jgi:hypothetical protein
VIIEVKKEGVFIPKFGGNKTLPESEQIKVKHRFLTVGERDKYIYVKPVKVNQLKGTVDGESEAIQDMKGIVLAIVTGIDNFELMVGKKKVKVDTTEKLYNTEGVPNSLVKEIEIYMLNVSPVVDKSFLE